MADASPNQHELNPAEITQLLSESASGSTDACNRLLTLVYAELHTLARSRMRGEGADHTLSATALVNEAYMRLFRATGQDTDNSGAWANRSKFFAAAATAMRRILIDHARAKATAKRGGSQRSLSARVTLDVLQAARSLDPEDVLALDDAISRLEEVDDRSAKVVRLRFYAGLEIADVAQTLDVSERTVKRDWEFARAWLKDAMGVDADTAGDQPPGSAANDRD